MTRYQIITLIQTGTNKRNNLIYCNRKHLKTTYTMIINLFREDLLPQYKAEDIRNISIHHFRVSSLSQYKIHFAHFIRFIDGDSYKVLKDRFTSIVNYTISQEGLDIIRQADISENIECNIEGEFKLMNEYRILVEPGSKEEKGFIKFMEP